MFAEIKNAKVYYEVRGGGGKKLALMHGWGGNTESFLPLLRDLDGEFSMLVFDFPGHGHSSEPPEPWSVTDYMEMTCALMKQTGFIGCDVVAHSFGARVAILLAAEHPKTVKRMLLTGAAGLQAPPREKPSAQTRAYNRLKKLASLPVIPQKAQERLRESLIQKYGSADYRACTPSMRATFNRVIHQDLRPCLGRIQAPVFLFWGEDDTATPLWMGRVMEKEIPDAALQVESGCGHFAYLEHYDRFKNIALALFA